MDPNQPLYKISGDLRKVMKRELASLKSLCKDYWHEYHMDCDMASFFGGGPGFPMTKEEAQKKYQQISKRIAQLESELSQTVN